MFPWAKYRAAKGGVKAHVLISHDDYMPSFVHISDAKKADVKAARMLNLKPGSIVAMDRAYNDYGMFSRWTDAGVFFVTRLKSNAVYEVVEEGGETMARCEIQAANASGEKTLVGEALVAVQDH